MPPYFLKYDLKSSISMSVGMYTTPNFRVWVLTSSPAYSAFLPTSCLPITSAELIADDCASLGPQRYGAWRFAFFAVVEKPKFGIFALASSVSNTSRPATMRSNTANGFIALIATASARCAASSLPDDVSNLISRSRPHVSKYFIWGINMSWMAFS